MSNPAPRPPMAAESPSRCNAIAQRTPSARSRVSNGAALLGGIDGRSAAARRLNDLIDDLARDLGSDLTEVDLQQIRVTAGAILHSEQLLAAMVRGESVRSEEITRASNVASRLLAGLKRRKPAKPSSTSDFRSYIAAPGDAA
jgi:hypothetical protein